MERSRSGLKEFFETGDIPTQDQFADFIESVPNFVTDKCAIIAVLHSQFNFELFQPNSGDTSNMQIDSLPNGALPIYIWIKNTLQWSGGAVDTATVTIDVSNIGTISGDMLCSSDEGDYFGIFSDCVNVNATNTITVESGTAERDVNVTLAVEVSGGGPGDINDLDQGTTDVFIYYIDPGL